MSVYEGVDDIHHQLGWYRRSILSFCPLHIARDKGFFFVKLQSAPGWTAASLTAFVSQLPTINIFQKGATHYDKQKNTKQNLLN